MIVENGKVQLSPAYDLLNTSIILKGDIDEIALSMHGKKKKLNRDILINYFGKERCSINDKIIEKTLNTINEAIPSWIQWIENSFLSQEMKTKYKLLLENRMKVLGFSHIDFI